MQVACRWPGGMDILIPKFNRTVHLNGPKGVASILPAFGRSAPSRNVAMIAQKAVADTVKRMEDTADSFAAHEYGVTDVPDFFWNAWADAHADKDVITKKMVFVLG